MIYEREAVIETVAEFYTRLGMKKARVLPLSLSTDCQPTPDKLQAIPRGVTFVRFKLIGPS